MAAPPAQPRGTELERLPDRLSPGPAIGPSGASSSIALKRRSADLTPRQREVFVAIALNDVPIDVLALELGSNRNAIYKNLFDARRRLRASLAARATRSPRRSWSA